jgi:hypothetical protein
MTVHPRITAAFREWNNTHPGTVLGGELKESFRTAYLARIHPELHSHRISPYQCLRIAHEISDKRRPQFDGTSIRHELETNENFALYVGYTARMIVQEDLRWLTTRGSHLRKGVKYKGGRNRPVLQFKDKRKPIIGMKFARTNLRFKSILVFNSPCQLNALDVEAKLQILLRDYPLGIRLWRHTARGSKDRFKLGYYKVFITHSRIVRKRCGKDIKIVA